MYKNKAKQQEANRLIERNTRKGVTLDNTHPLIYALIDPVKRKRLESICTLLKTHHVSEAVFYGCRSPVPFNVVSDYLDCLTKKQ